MFHVKQKLLRDTGGVAPVMAALSCAGGCIAGGFAVYHGGFVWNG